MNIQLEEIGLGTLNLTHDLNADEHFCCNQFPHRRFTDRINKIHLTNYKAIFLFIHMIIISKAHQQHKFPWCSLVFRPYQRLHWLSPPDSTQYLHRADECSFFSVWTKLVCLCVGVHRRMMSMSSLLLQQFLECLVRLSVVL